MGLTVWLAANTLNWPRGGGGYLWQYLNWALALRSLGCDVVWLEPAAVEGSTKTSGELLQSLRENLAPYGLADAVAVCSSGAEQLADRGDERCVPLATATDADLLLNLSYELCRPALPLFKRTCLLDTDPGLSQIWHSEGVTSLPPHDVFFSIGERVAEVEQHGIRWQYTPPCVALDWWPECPPSESAPFTTVSNWDNPEWVTWGDHSYNNNKRSGFAPFLDLPGRSPVPLELALCLEADDGLSLAPWQEEERQRLVELGWRVVHAYTVADRPWDFQRYVQRSRGEFSCAKPSYTHLRNGWVSDRTVCYLASGKPAVVQDTGPSSVLPDRCGALRFGDIDEAVECLRAVSNDYEAHCRAARKLAEEHFAGIKVAREVIERAI
jgi:hypothetical protein